MHELDWGAIFPIPGGFTACSMFLQRSSNETACRCAAVAPATNWEYPPLATQRMPNSKSSQASFKKCCQTAERLEFGFPD